MADESTQFKFMRYLHEMDFQSQKKAETLFKVIIITVATVSVINTQISYAIADIYQQFSICVYATLAAMVVCYIIIVPGQAPWWRKPLPQFRPEAEKIKNKKD